MTADPRAHGPLEMWAGIECTVNRVGHRFCDQLERSGHAARTDDLDRLAGLGVRTVRYPVLWERTTPSLGDEPQWAWPDERLARLRELGIRPIVGLVHHGSGPAGTSLLSRSFASGLERYAAQVARRYPWVELYTPVNEPLTTARFSGLYGHWYPHRRDDASFVRCLLSQCRGTVLSMRAIRAINPSARLVQTEDLGKAHSTRTLAYQAEWENHRRWLSFDLLCGRVGPEHPLWPYLRSAGATEKDLRWFTENPCPPDILGINHYLTSERYLDERLERYGECGSGGNGRHRYVDVAAVRVLREGIAGPRTLLLEAWERYHLPLAVTEAHLGCTREEQMRWLWEVWRSAELVRAEGADVRAVTAWSAFGAFDWNSLLCRLEGFYEPGLFDLRSTSPRETALAKLARELAAGREPAHPVLAIAGWWRRPDRLLYPPVQARNSEAVPAPYPVRAASRIRPVLITGATGTLGQAFAQICQRRGLSHHLLSRREMDIASRESVEAVLGAMKPWGVINTAGYVRVDDAEREVDTCRRENLAGPAVLAEACRRAGTGLVTFSSDLVFDGAQQRPYIESDAANPLNVYGRSKLDAERVVLETLPSALVVRTSAFFGPWDGHNFIIQALRTLAAGASFTAADDATVSPTYVPDLVDATLDLLIDGASGVWHLANAGAITWVDLARRAAELTTLPAWRVEGRPTAELGLAAARPLYSVLDSERGRIMPSLDEALGRYVCECQLWQESLVAAKQTA